VASSWLGDLFVVVPGQWRRIIGSSQKGATPKFKKLFKRSNISQNGLFRIIISLKDADFMLLNTENPSTRLNPNKRGR
ncbi:hypothetical protein, partial [Serratia fonticola]|uniref:hypothetical protein n=1 Tax=Serratia fonticola TaxID=47917 RepID=UPI001AEA1C89